MIKLGPAGSPTADTLSGIGFVAGHGLDALEVEFVYGVRMKNDLAKKVGEAARQLNIELTAHAPYYINLASEDEKKRKASIQRILESCERAHHMNAKYVVFHAAFYGKHGKEEVYDTVRSSVDNMKSIIKKNSWKTELAPETTGKRSQFGTLDELVQLSKDTGCGLCIDFAHIYARNNGRIDYEKVLDKVKHVKHLHTHFSGINYGPSGELNHLVINHHPDFVSLAKLILKRKTDITIICESPVTWKDSLKMKKIFEGMSYSWGQK